jgi:membrane fusion protein (multidrug efflux system)
MNSKDTPNKKKQDIFDEEAKIRLKARRARKRKTRKPYQKKRVLVPAICMIALLACGIMSFFNSLKYQSTDDAFIEGRLVSLAPKVSGQIIKLHFNDNDFVKKGQLLVEIDPRDYQNKVKELEGAVSEASANKNVSSNDTSKSQADLTQTDKALDSAKSKLNFAQKDLARYTQLKKDGLCTKQQYDESKTKLDVAKAEYNEALANKSAMAAAVKSSQSKIVASGANIEKLQAQLAQAKLNLSYTKIYAPQSGNISSRSVEQGNFVQVGQPLTAIVSPNIWIIANFKETQLTKMQKGQPVTIKIDRYPGKKFIGRVDSIQQASGAKASLFPPENAVGSYVKVVQRIPVKIVFEGDYKKYDIAPGMSVVPKVKIK